MKIFTRRLLLACLGWALVAAPLQAATQHKAGTKTTQKKASSKSAKPAVPASKGKRAAATKSGKAAAGKSNSGSACKTIRVKTAKGYVNRRSCKESAPAEARSLTSPITDNALTKTAPTSSDVVKARTVPDRAYAVDGQTFFYQGRKYRVAGLKGNDNSDMAKQRLQRSLESGSLSVSPLRTDEAGVATATVRVNGRDIAEEAPGN